jgi:hypothetical protein
MLWFLKIFPFLTQNKAKLCNYLSIHNIGFCEKRPFFRRKSQKIVIITSTSDGATSRNGFLWGWPASDIWCETQRLQNRFLKGCTVCQMVSFQTKNFNLGKFWWALDWKMFIYFMAIWNILQTFWIFNDHLVHFVFIWSIFPVLVSCAKKNLATLLGSEQ